MKYEVESGLLSLARCWLVVARCLCSSNLLVVQRQLNKTKQQRSVLLATND